MAESLDRNRLIALRDALTPLQDQFNLSHLVCLLTIGAEPGLSVKDLADRTRAPQASASRYVSILLGRYQGPEGKFPAPLISQEISKEDPRRRALFLNDQGKTIVNTIFEAMNVESFIDQE